MKLLVYTPVEGLAVARLMRNVLDGRFLSGYLYSMSRSQAHVSTNHAHIQCFCFVCVCASLKAGTV